MAGVILKGNISGQVELNVPDVAGTNVINVPAQSGQMALTSDIKSMVLLGTLTTTSGLNQILSGLNLTDYMQLYCRFINVSTAGGATLQLDGQKLCASVAATDSIIGWVTVDLGTGAGMAWLFNGASGSGNTASPYYAKTSYTTASTSITFTASASTFDAGSILVYGVK